MSKGLPIHQDIIIGIRKELEIKQLANASIRNIVQLINRIESKTSVKFIRTEMGVPGLPAPEIAIKAEIEALKSGIASIYPPIEGIAELKKEVARFVKLFMNVEVHPENCISTVGSMQGSMAAFLVVNRCWKDRAKTLFIDPGFPVNKRQLMVLGLEFEHFDIYNYRGNKLKEKLKSYLDKGTISSIIYSNPNNPSWICFTERELEIIGNLSNEYKTIVIEDLAYFGMDFRRNFGQPGKKPFQPTVAHYTDNFILLISSSKAFSYAGQRVAAMVVSRHLYHQEFTDLLNYFSTSKFGHAIVQDAIYTLSAGVSYSPQVGMAAILKTVNDGEFDFVENIKEYGKRAKAMKKAFIENGFNIVYDKDDNVDIADGFYFTVAFQGLSGEQLLSELLQYGISAITLDSTGSEHTEGLRICVSRLPLNEIPILEERLKLFRQYHS